MINIPYQPPIPLPPMPYFEKGENQEAMIQHFITYISSLHQTLNNLIIYTNSLSRVFTEVDIYLNKLSIEPNPEIQEKIEQSFNIIAENSLKAYELKLEELKKQYELD